MAARPGAVREPWQGGESYRRYRLAEDRLAVVVPIEQMVEMVTREV